MKLKRVFDLIITVPLLMLFLLILLLISFLVWLTSGPPIFFKQERVGRYGKLFKIIKFRTMISNAEKMGGRITASYDQRITKIGRILRRYKLDELPQLFNVLRGEMSLVGPRPEVPKYVALYPVAIREKVLSVRPGITDIASIKFHDEEKLLALEKDIEAAYIKKILPTKLRLITEYVEKCCLLLDIKLLIMTILKLAYNKHIIKDEI